MSGGATLSAFSTKIVKPGYHIRPQYDLHGLRHRRTAQGHGAVAGELPLTSMIDMFSILVIYLLMNFSSTGEIFFVNKNLVLPQASQTNPLMNGPLISIVGEKFVLDAPPALDSLIKAQEDDSLGLEKTVAGLKELKALADTRKLEGGQRINIQADGEAPLGLVKRAMTAAVTAGWTNINFVVDKSK